MSKNEFDFTTLPITSLHFTSSHLILSSFLPALFSAPFYYFALLFWKFDIPSHCKESKLLSFPSSSDPIINETAKGSYEI